MKYCSECGAELSYRIPEKDDRPRYICDNCRITHYENPNMVVGAIPVLNDSILFCRRAIEPRYGKWTLPAGFLENGETVAAGARRETLEEAGARIVGLEPYALYNLTFVNQVYLMFRAILPEPVFSAGDESLEVRLFKAHEVPWKELAFPVIRKTLEDYFHDLNKGAFSFHMDDIVRAPEEASPPG